MKDDSPTQSSALPESERLVDAALQEHARLGSNRNDEALIDRILLETVNKETVSASIAVANPAPWKSLLIGASSAAAALTLGFLFLQSFQLQDESGSAQEVHFVVRILDESPAVEPEGEINPVPNIASSSSSSTIEPTFAQVDAVVRPYHFDGNFFLETKFGKSITQLPEKAHLHNSFLISAEEVVQTDHETQFNGNVLVAHDTWKIQAASAIVPNSGDTVGKPSPTSTSLTALDVVVTQSNPQRLVRAEQLSYDAVTGSLLLTGIRLIEAAEGTLTDFDRGDQLTMTENSYSIESLPLIKYASPEPVKPGKR